MESRPRILIVDDDHLIRDILRATLGPKYECVTTSCAGDALMIMRSRPFDLVILDIGLPDCSGFAVNLYVRRERSETAVIFISSTVDEAIIQIARESGAREFLRKPFTPAQLEAVVERVLRDRATHAA